MLTFKVVYLDNPTFRGMRQALLNDFDEIYIVDLHGNAKKKETALDGAADKNVFDIQQGVAIGIFIKHQQKKSSMAKIHHAHLFGERQTKYQWLAENDIKTTAWTILKPQSPFYLFVPQNTDLLPEYNQGWKITDMMPLNGVGMTTARDDFVIDFDKETLLKRIEAFKNSQLCDDDLHREFEINKKEGWDIRKSWKLLQSLNDEQFKNNCVEVLYRPFDKRHIYYHDAVVWRTVKKIMQHMILGENLGLITIRRSRSSNEWNQVFTSNNVISGSTAISSLDINYLFPLYIYPTEKNNLFNLEHTTRHANFSPDFIDYLEQHLNLKFIIEEPGDFATTISALDVFNYIYAVLHSPTYRQRYAEFLKMDFPRVPITHDKNLFQQLVVVGKNLIAIHLMQADIENDSGFNIAGDNLVEKIEFKDGKVYINKTQYFDNVSSEVWEFHIGGYQVCQKWLKDRKGMILDYAACKNYLYILAALEKTRALMAQIDEIIPSFPFDREQNHA